MKSKQRVVEVEIKTSFTIDEDDLEEDTLDWTDEDLIQYATYMLKELGGVEGVTRTFGAEVDKRVRPKY